MTDAIPFAERSSQAAPPFWGGKYLEYLDTEDEVGEAGSWTHGLEEDAWMSYEPVAPDVALCALSEDIADSEPARSLWARIKEGLWLLTRR